MLKRNIIVVGASAGGLEALQTIVHGLPSDFRAPLLIVRHNSPDYASQLPHILMRSGPLKAAFAADGEAVTAGRIYIAPSGYHLMVEDGLIRLSKGPKENRFRPAIDPLFRSAAFAYRQRVVGVVLSGALDDGTAGLWAIKQHGGLVIVQEPNDALVPSMPLSALRHVAVDYRLPASEIAPLLVRLTTKPAVVEGEYSVSEELKIETRIAKGDNALAHGVLKLGKPSLYTCPECHGVLLQIHDGTLQRYRCHTGHAYSLDTLLSEMTETIEEQLWCGLRALEENIMLLQEIVQHAHEEHDAETVAGWEQKALEAEQRAQLIRQAVMGIERVTGEITELN